MQVASRSTAASPSSPTPHRRHQCLAVELSLVSGAHRRELPIQLSLII